MAFALWYGSYEPWNLDFRGWDEPPLDSLLRGLEPPEDAIKIDSIFISETKKNILENPLSYLKMSFKKTWNLWRPIPGEKHQVFNSNILFYTLRLYHSILILSMFFGIFISIKNSVNYEIVLILIFIIFYWTGIHAIIISVPRHLLPLYQLVMVFSSAGIISAINFFTRMKN